MNVRCHSYTSGAASKPLHAVTKITWNDALMNIKCPEIILLTCIVFLMCIAYKPGFLVCWHVLCQKHFHLSIFSCHTSCFLLVLSQRTRSHLTITVKSFDTCKIISIFLSERKKQLFLYCNIIVCCKLTHIFMLVYSNFC